MQISRVYSNHPQVFPAIDFNSGKHANRLNIIYGEVHHPKDLKRSSHNLGKTTLLNLIDFLMLKGMSPDQFLARHKERFTAFIFFIEISLNDGGYATIRRGVDDPNQVALKKHLTNGQNFFELPEKDWDHFNISREEAVKLTDAWLNLTILKPYEYRIAITYLLRAQGDYSDELQLQKFLRGKDRSWKPFVAHLFGFNEQPVQRKYELDEEIERLKLQLEEKQSEVQYSEDHLPELSARIALLQEQLAEIEESLDAFSFSSEEKRITKEVVESIEVETANTNERLYNISFDIKQITAALEHKDRFDLEEVDSIFKESKLYFPDQLRKEYADLVDFNKRITKERNAALRTRKKALEKEEAELNKRKEYLDDQRMVHLKIIRSTDTFDKFKELQKQITKERAQLVYLQEQKKKLERVVEIANSIREIERERGRVIDEIKTMLARLPATFKRFSSIFSGYCQRVLDHDGLFYFKINSNNNLDYHIGLSLPGRTGVLSSQSEGTSYKKLICALFDLALLKVYEDSPFFHFVYHDGVLEGLDDRKKNALLAIVREQIANLKTQYVFTMIDADVPRNASDERIKFNSDEIILRLSDEGSSGRLFKMAEF